MKKVGYELGLPEYALFGDYAEMVTQVNLVCVSCHGRLLMRIESLAVRLRLRMVHRLASWTSRRIHQQLHRVTK